MRLLKNIILFGIALTFAACSDSEKTVGDLIPVPESDNIELSTEESKINTRINDGAFTLLNQMALNYEHLTSDNDGNITVSPVSIYLALSMIANSVEESSTDICALYGVQNIDQLNTLGNKLMRYLSSSKNGATLRLANSVWHKEGLVLSKAYTSLMNGNYYAEVNPVDFNTIEGVGIINSWVTAKTNSMIDRLLEEPLSIEVLIANAMYFQGEWLNPFDPKLTETMAFNGTTGITNVDMMKEYSALIEYSKNDDYEIGTLHFNGPTAMTIVKPLKTDALEAAKTITPDVLSSETRKNSYNIRIPKFKIGHTWESLKELMNGLGIRLNGSLKPMGLNMDAQLKFVHKTAMIVEEKGVTAAATTGGAFSTAVPPTDRDFNVDRPFLFFIQNTVTGSIIMCGCINNI